MTDAQEPVQPPLPSLEDARETLVFCREQPAHPEALPKLNDLRDFLLEPSLAGAVLEACEAVVRAVREDPAPGPVVQAHMVILLTTLLSLSAGSGRVDVLLADWMRHPSSFGAGRATPAEFQKPEWVQRVADLLGWGTLDVQRDRDALKRFFSWVNSWKPRHRWQVRRIIQALERNFPAPDVWKMVHFPGA